MIVATTGDGYRFTTQPEHAGLAGQFADRWGNDAFDRPEPLPAVVAATNSHDDGWWPFDSLPRLDDDGTPLNFTGVAPETWIGIYDRGIQSVIEVDRYAGLLVSMHGTGLRNRRYGLSPSWPPTPPAFEAFVTAQETRQRQLLSELAADPRDDRVDEADERLLEALHGTGSPPEDATSRLWTNYRLLQAWDSLSLSLCSAVPPPAEHRIDAVPRTHGGDACSLGIAAAGDAAFSIDPYPFDTEPLSVTVASRTVDRLDFTSEEDLFEAYYNARREVRTFEFRAR